jgi:hypothetical protein
MAQEQGLLWRCEYEDCGHRWVAASREAPEKCGKCRRRGWHKTETTAELVKTSGIGLDERIRKVAREVFEEMMAGLPVEEVEGPAAAADDDSLAGRMAAAQAALASIGQPKVVEVMSSVATAGAICGMESFNDGDGEVYRCCLPPHGPKVKHGAWMKL